MIEATPLQAYMSALAFCPLESRIGFAEELPQHYRPVSGVHETWGNCLHTLLCQSSDVATYDDFTKSMVSTANILASASSGGTVRIWNPETGICLQVIEIPHDGSRNKVSMALSEDGKLLATRLESFYNSAELLVWDTSTGECLLTIEAGEYRMDALVFLNDNHLAAMQENLFTLWDSTTGERREVVQLFESPDRPGVYNVAAISPDGRAAAALPPNRTTSGDDFHRIGLWDANRHLYMLEGHGSMAGSLAFSPDGLRLVSATSVSIKLWDSASGACVRTLDMNPTRIEDISLTRENGVLWFSTGGLNLWDLATDSWLKYPENRVSNAQFLGDKRQIAVAQFRDVPSWSSTIKILDEFVFAQKRPRYNTWTVAPELYSSADGSVLVSTDLDPTGARRLIPWDPKTGACLYSARTYAWMATRVLLERSRLSYAIPKWGDGGDGGIELHRLATDEHLVTLLPTALELDVTSETVSADGRKLILGLRSGEVEICDTAAKIWAGRIQFVGTVAHSGAVISVACSQDGRMLVTAMAGTAEVLVLKVWNLNTSSCVGIIEETSRLLYEQLSMATSSDGKLVAVLLYRYGAQIAVWNAHKRKRLLTVKGFIKNPNIMSFSTTGPLRLQTDLGVWNLPPRLLSSEDRSISVHELEFHGYGVTPDSAWIVKGTEKIMWIPYDYRGPVVVRGSRIVIGLGWRVIIFNLPADDVSAEGFGLSI